MDADGHKLLVLVGDTYQINSIEFGNWFDIASKFVSDASVYELTIPWCSSDGDLEGIDAKRERVFSNKRIRVINQ
jgi:hypothetical protein